MNQSYEEMFSELARDYGLEIARNVFHSTDSVELRRVLNNVLACVGVIYGSEDLVVYTRRLNRRKEWARNNLWFFGSLINWFSQTQENSYKEIAEWHHSGVSVDEVRQVIQKALGVNRRVKE